MKVKKRIPTRRYYTPQEVDDNIGINRMPWLNLLYTRLARALSKLPKHIVNKVLKKCFFITFPGMMRGYCFPSSLDNRTLIYISWQHLKRAKPEKVEHTILHEIAHWYLNHDVGKLTDSPINSTVAETKKIESEADQKVKKWLQEYERQSSQTDG